MALKKGKERSREGKKRRVTIMEDCVTEKAATEKTKIKGRKIKLKHFSTADTGRAVRKK